MLPTIQQINKINNDKEIYKDFVNSHFEKKITTEFLVSKHKIGKHYIRRCKAYVRGKQKLPYSHETFPQPHSNASFERFKKEIDRLISSGERIVVNKIAKATNTDHETIRCCLCYYAGLNNDLNWIKFK
jgi:O6-methylguanine-DNA--protein-cysteine methyltransferase